MRVSDIKQKIRRLRSGAIALLFLAAYGIAALAPFVPTQTAFADTTDSTNIQTQGFEGRDTSHQPITFCHATGSDSNPYVKLTTDAGAFYRSGHINHTGDIYPAGAFTKGGHDFSWDAQGDQSLLQYPDCKKPNVKINVPLAPKVYDPCGFDNATWIVPEDTSTITWKLLRNGHLVASTTSGYEFTNGQTEHDYGVAPDSGKPCVTFVRAEAPTSSDPCGISNDTFTIPSVEGVQYLMKVGKDYRPINPGTYPANGASVEIKAVAKEGYVLIGQDCWDLCFTSKPCEVRATKPTGSDFCGTSKDTFTIPSVQGVQYYVKVGNHYDKIAAGTYSANGYVVRIEAKAMDGYVLVGDDDWTLNFTNIRCLVEVTPLPPTQNVVCGPQNDTVTIPDVKGVYYKQFSKDGVTVVIAVPMEGYVFPEDTQYVWKFVDHATLCPVTPTVPVVETVCGKNNDLVTLPEDVMHVTYSQTGWVDGVDVVTATADEGYYIAGTEGETTMQWTFKDDATLCAATVAVPVDPTIVCGANNDVVTVPTSAHVTYTSTGWINGKNTITATVDPGYYIAGTQNLTTQSWTYTDTNTSCGQVLGASTTTPNVLAAVTPQLENTGNNFVLPMLMSTGVLGLAIMTVLQSSTRKSKLALLVEHMVAKFTQAIQQPFTVPAV